jgi:hypothetical protein
MNTIDPRSALFRRLRLLVLLVTLPAIASAAEVQAWLMFNPASAETIMSTDLLEKNHLVLGGWRVSGTGILQSDGVADSGLLHRMVRVEPKGASRMLVATMDEVEANLKAGFVTEGALGYVSLKPGPGLIAVHRFAKGGKSIWMIGAADQTWAEKNGWKREQPAFWLWPDQYR